MDDTLGFVRRITRTVLLVLLLGILINDGARLAMAVSKASDGLTASMNAALSAVSAAPSGAVGAQAAATAAAEQQGVVLESYNQTAQTSGASNRVTVTLEVSAPLVRTIVAGPLVGALTKVPSNQWFLPGAVKVKLRSTKEVNAFGTNP